MDWPQEFMLALAGTVAAREATIPYPPHTIPVEECCSEQLVLHWQWWDVVESCLCQGLTTWELYLWWITWHCFSRDGWSLSFALYSPEDSSGRGTHHLANPPGFLVSGSPAVHCSHKWSPKSTFLSGDFQMCVLLAKLDGPCWLAHPGQ